MAQRTCRFLSAGILGLALAFSLASCGDSSPAPVDETTSQEEQAADAGASEDREAAEDSDPMEGLAFHENDYLTIGLADGWAVNTDVSENKHIDNEDGSGYYFGNFKDDNSGKTTSPSSTTIRPSDAGASMYRSTTSQPMIGSPTIRMDPCQRKPSK